jgi:two-component system, OmpR family, response regulator QseB
MRILFVEDDERIAQPLAEDLRHQYHIVDIAEDGITAWEYTQSVVYDLILLDWMLPRLDGITLCKRLRSAGCTVPVLMLTAKDTTTDKVMGLDAGADDYIIKPFDLEELSARVRALSRRSLEARLPVLSCGNLRLDPSTCKVTYEENELSLTPKEYMILELLLRNPTVVFSRAALLEKLWEVGKLPAQETVKTHITSLRRKLKEAGGSEELIETVYGLGYRLRGN